MTQLGSAFVETHEDRRGIVVMFSRSAITRLSACTLSLPGACDQVCWAFLDKDTEELLPAEVSEDINQPTSTVAQQCRRINCIRRHCA
ncbi:hypothetical protein BBK82_13080 [Lentzea guizhouensis]|uniref:Uncharacterized protein n=1 Tax=Lentzea guizhouensis TaxID=1586287 RepID=A0A1B2HGL4_9PSEU|nr:hypothetical protein BBK82_13080 [Lentzea guizhouensis]